jgi:putative glycosyltransferase (TIGR04372 family)
MRIKKFLFNSLDKMFGKLAGTVIAFFSQLLSIKYTATNLWGSLGHTLTEIDYFLRMVKIDKVKKKNRIVFLSPGNNMSKEIYDIFKKNFFFSIISNYLEKFFKKRVLNNRENLCLDFGLGSIALNEKEKPLEKVLIKYIDYYKIIKKTKNFKPIKIINFENSLEDFLKFDTKQDPYIVLQIKETSANGTAIPTNINSYIKTIKYFSKRNYKFVFAGSQEKFPKIFKKYNVINYNSFKKKTLSTDISLVSRSKLVICGASGYGWVPSLLEIPCVWANNWQIPHSVNGRYTIKLPYKFYNKYENKMAKYDEMINHFLKIDNYDFKSFEKYEVLPVSSNDILKASNEALEIKKNYIGFSNNYKKFISRYKNLPIYYSYSRISESFINKNKKLFF